MSRESLEAFLDRLMKDPVLERQLQDEAKGAADPAAAVVSVAARSGFEFTAGEFLQSQVPDAELTDAELAGISGGAEMGCSQRKKPYPTASASVSARGVISQERPQRSLHHPH